MDFSVFMRASGGTEMLSIPSSTRNWAKPIPEVENKKTPDFSIEFAGEGNDGDVQHKIFGELKSMAFAAGNLNYRSTMDQAFKVRVSQEEQRKKGKRLTMGETEIAPYGNSNKRITSKSTRLVVETLIQKIDQNLKKGQIKYGPTVLLVDLKQLIFQGVQFQDAVPIYQKHTYGSSVSGALWNAAFGKAGHLIFQPIMVEGTENTDGELEQNGILTANSWVEAIVFFQYRLSERIPKIIGLHRSNDLKESVELFLCKFCDFVNDDRNSNGWRLNADGTLKL